MAGYQRFVAYVYEYRKGKKDGSSGYVRVEARDRKCRIEVHLRCVGLEPGSRCRVYGFVRREGLMDGILIGSCMTGRERIECMLETDTEDIGGMGKNLQNLGGMLLISDAGGFWGTEWDDQPIRPENFREWKKEKKVNADEKREAGIVVEAEPKKKQNAENKNTENQVREELIRQENTEDARMKKHEQLQIVNETEHQGTNRQEEMQQEVKERTAASESKTMIAEEIRESEQTNYSGLQGSESNIKCSEAKPHSQLSKSPEHPGTHPGTSCTPFPDGQFTDCRKIKPSDCNLLCRKNGCFCSNRFVMYGYQNFGHLLLGRNHQGQYILGVPGSYSQQERFMANMFGFPYFKESPDIRIPGGKGGYWYCFISM